MAKYNKRISERIVKLIEEDNYSIIEICSGVGVGTSTFYRWKDEHKDFRHAIETALVARDERMVLKARKALRNKLDNYTITETKITYSVTTNEDEVQELRVKEYTVKEKHMAPETSAIISTLNNYGKDDETSKKQMSNLIPLSITVSSDKTAQDLSMLKKALSI